MNQKKLINKLLNAESHGFNMNNVELPVIPFKNPNKKCSGGALCFTEKWEKRVNWSQF